jgi:hypothetical protein
VKELLEVLPTCAAAVIGWELGRWLDGRGESLAGAMEATFKLLTSHKRVGQEGTPNRI